MPETPEGMQDALNLNGYNFTADKFYIKDTNGLCKRPNRH